MRVTIPRLRRFAAVVAVGIAFGWGLAIPSSPAPPNTPAKPVKAAPDFSAQRVMRALRSDNEDSIFDALETIRQHHLQEAELPEAMWRVLQPARDGKKELTRAMLATITLYTALTDEKHFQRHREYLKSDDIRIVISAAIGMAERKDPAIPPAPKAIRERPEYTAMYGVRSAVVAIAAQYEDAPAVDFLIDILTKHDGQLRYEAARQLGRLTRKNFGGKPKEWRGWWDEHRSDFDPAEVLQVSTMIDPVDIPWEEPIPRFMGIPIYAKRVLFVFARGVDGPGLAYMKQEVQRCFYDLPTSTYLNSIAYDTQPRYCHPQPVQATSQNIAEDLVFVDNILKGLGPLVFDSLSAAMTHDSNTEAIVFLTTGHATSLQPIMSHARYLTLLTRANAMRRITIHTAALDPLPNDEQLLKLLSGRSRGTYRPVH